MSLPSLPSISIAAGLTCYLFYKRCEPKHPFIHLATLIGVPLALSTRFCQTSSLAVFLTLAYYLGTVILSVLAYRLSPVHPLASYPGPVLYKATKLWSAWISLTGKQHLHYEQLHRRYGDIVRIGPNELSIIDPGAIAPLMGSSELPKGPLWDGRQADLKVPSLVGERDAREHARRRRPWNRGLSTTALKDYEVVLAKRTTQLASALAQQSGSVDLAQWINYFAYDFMSDMGFGGGSDMIRDGDRGHYWKILDDGLPAGLFLGHVPWLAPYYTRLPFVGKGLKIFRQFTAQRALARKVEGPTSKDLFYYLNNEDGFDATQPTMPEIISGGALVILAGSDTTATTLSNVFYLIATHPTTYVRLRDEVDKQFPPGENCLDPAVHAKMPYLNAVINEALRLFPPVPSGSQRANPSESETRLIGQYAIPPGTAVIMPHWPLHRDPRHFSPSPDEFLPERWLPRETQIELEPEIYGKADLVDIRHDTNAFIPFSFGPSNCAGKNLAYQEMRMVICLLVKTFDMKLSLVYAHENGRWTDSLEDLFVLKKGRLMMDLTQRDGAHSLVTVGGS